MEQSNLLHFWYILITLFPYFKLTYMKAKAILFLCAFYSLLMATAQTSSDFSLSSNASEQASIITKQRKSVVFIQEPDSPSTMQIIYFNDSKSTKVEHDEKYYLKMAKSERTRGIVFTTLGYPMIGAGTYLFVAGIQKFVNGDGFDGDEPGGVAPVVSAIINGAGLLAAGIPFAIKGPMALADAKYFKKKAAEQKTSFEVEPTILRTREANTACGVVFRLHF